MRPGSPVMTKQFSVEKSTFSKHKGFMSGKKQDHEHG